MTINKGVWIGMGTTKHTLTATCETGAFTTEQLCVRVALKSLVKSGFKTRVLSYLAAHEEEECFFLSYFNFYILTQRLNYDITSEFKFLRL